MHTCKSKNQNNFEKGLDRQGQIWYNSAVVRERYAMRGAPHVDCGNFVIIVNAEKAVLTGNKMTDKYYYHHSGYIGGMKKVQYKTLMATKPERAMELAVKGMLPDTVIGRKAFTRLKVYAGATHNHEAQKPQVYDL